MVSGEPLFASTTKYDSRTGWPSFTAAIEPDNIVKRRDFRALGLATEVRSANGDSHLGHLFHDGPKEAGGLRYCINSAALRFVPVDDLEREGYGAYREAVRAGGRHRELVFLRRAWETARMLRPRCLTGFPLRMTRSENQVIRPSCS